MEIPAYGSPGPGGRKRAGRVQTGQGALRHLQPGPATGGAVMGELSVWTGKRGEGKSTCWTSFCWRPSTRGSRCALTPVSSPPGNSATWASLQAAGPKNLQVRKDQLSGREIPHPTPFAQQMIDEWWRGRFLLYDIGTSTYHDAANILRVFRYAHRRYGAKVYLVDNLMTARFRGNDRDFYRAHSEFVAELASFAHDNNVHVHLVAHPRKTDRISDSDEVAGIGDVTNLADNVYVLEKEEREDRQQDSVLTILKNRFFGERGRSIGLNFERKSKRFYKSGTGNPDKVYGWALSGRQAVVDLPEGGETCSRGAGRRACRWRSGGWS
ncbi:MAG: AAA family ATPase [Flavonifractor plautii]